MVGNITCQNGRPIRALTPVKYNFADQDQPALATPTAKIGPDVSFINYLRQEGDVFIGVCFFVDYAKNYSTDFYKIRWKGGAGTTEETVRFWWYSGSRYVRVRIGVRLGLRLGGRTATLHMGGCVTRDLFNSHNFVTSAALAEVCARLSVILVLRCHKMLSLHVYRLVHRLF